MLIRKNRLTSERDFARIFKKGKLVHGPALSVRVLANNLPETRTAFVVSTKVSKRAVVRNRIKRRLREIVRRLLPGLASGMDVVVIVKVQSVGLSSAELEAATRETFRKARLL